MSGHLIGCVKPIQTLGRSHKLALIAFADSADDRTHISFPGYEGVMAWASCSRSRAAELIKDLVEQGYLTLYKAARRGQRAEYIVFPEGCCELHRVPAEEDTSAPVLDVDELATAAGIGADQVRALLAALTPGLPATDPEDTGNGSDTSDTSPLTGSDVSDPNDPVIHRYPEMGPGRRTRSIDRVQTGSDASDPFTSSSTSPHTPQADDQPTDQPSDQADQVDAAAATSGPLTSVDAVRCPVHPNGHPNCRGCGTSPKQRREAARRREAEAEAARRRAEQREAAQRRAALASLRDPAGARSSIEAAKALARQGIAAAKTTTTGTGQ